MPAFPRSSTNALIGIIAALIMSVGVALAQTPGAPAPKPPSEADKAKASKAPAKADAAADKAAKTSTAVDNTAINARDKSGTTVTPQKQSTRTQDREIAANVRKAIVGDKALSMNAHNVKVMTINGTVTLRGPVANNAEKQRLGVLAKEVAGVTEVINNVDVPPPKPPKKKH